VPARWVERRPATKGAARAGDPLGARSRSWGWPRPGRRSESRSRACRSDRGWVGRQTHDPHRGRSFQRPDYAPSGSLSILVPSRWVPEAREGPSRGLGGAFHAVSVRVRSLGSTKHWQHVQCTAGRGRREVPVSGYLSHGTRLGVPVPCDTKTNVKGTAAQRRRP
jgi:hypothetical protein